MNRVVHAVSKDVCSFDLSDVIDCNVIIMTKAFPSSFQWKHTTEQFLRNTCTECISCFPLVTFCSKYDVVLMSATRNFSQQQSSQACEFTS